MITDLPTPISTDGPPIDVPLLRKAVEWAEAEAAKPTIESEWHQWEWVKRGEDIGRTCGTAYCIAGWTVFMTDGPLDPDDPAGIEDRAQELLGLTEAEAQPSMSAAVPGLFGAANSITDVRRIAERIAARAGERL